eukprot:1999033-Rhodomonas_salina.1
MRESERGRFFSVSSCFSASETGGRLAARARQQAGPRRSAGPGRDSKGAQDRRRDSTALPHSSLQRRHWRGSGMTARPAPTSWVAREHVWHMLLPVGRGSRFGMLANVLASDEDVCLCVRARLQEAGVDWLVSDIASRIYMLD